MVKCNFFSMISMLFCKTCILILPLQQHVKQFRKYDYCDELLYVIPNNLECTKLLSLENKVL